jgi:hypothetical protein
MHDSDVKRPPFKKLVPEWDVGIVLCSRMMSPNEALKDATLKYLT